MASLSTSKQLIGALLCSAAMLSASQVQALALGRLNVVSAQQQPLVMEVALAETEGVIADAIRPAIASAGEFAVAGLPYELWYQDIKVQVVQQDGQLFLSLTSPQPVSTEELDLLVQVEYMGGRLLGQFAAQFAAPGSPSTSVNETPKAPATAQPEVLEEALEEAQTQAIDNVVVEVETVALQLEEEIAPVVTEQQQLEAVVAQVSRQPEPEVVQAPKVPTPVVEPQSQVKQVVVRPGQTLWRIAADNTPSGLNTWQSLIAIYKTNSQAFKNQQINRIMAGAKLTIPGAQTMQEMTAGQAKKAYEQMLASYKVPAPKPQAPKPQVPKPEAIEVDSAAQAKAKQEAAKAQQAQRQQEQQLAKLNASIQALQNQSSGMQAQLGKLQQERQLAQQQAVELAKQNEILATGLANQQSDLDNLSANKQALKKDLTALDQRVSATDLQLKDKQQQLQDLESELVDLQRQKVVLQNANAAAAAQPTPAAQANDSHTGDDIALSKQLYPWLMGGLVVVLLGLLFSLLWRWLNGRPRHQQVMPEPAISDHEPAVVLDPLADYDARPSTQSQALHDAAVRMDKHEQMTSAAEQGEASFIEQLLQDQERPHSGSKQEDSVHLSAEVEAMLQQQRQANDQRHEPQNYQNAEDAIAEKLDLARSYKQMGQVDEAQQLLQQVLHEGNLEQQTQATLLLSRMRQD